MKKAIILTMALCFALSVLSGSANGWEIGFEAENADSITGSYTSGPFGPRGDVNASGDEYIGTENGDGDSNADPPGEDDGWAVYDFTAPPGVYKIVARIKRAGSNSFWVRVVDGDGVPVPAYPPLTPENFRSDYWIKWEGVRNIAVWDDPTDTAWDEVHSHESSTDPKLNRDPVEFTFEKAGDYQVQIARREDGVHLDCFIITDDLALAEGDLPNTLPYTDNRWRAENPTTSLSPATLSWDAPTTFPPPEAITRYDIYFGTSELVSDPNEGTTYLIDSVAGDAAVLQTDLATAYPELVTDSTYLWRVDAVIDVPDANEITATGFTWVYESLKLRPQIISQPEDMTVGLGCPGTFTVAAISGELGDVPNLAFAWKKVGSDTVLSTTNTLDATEAGSYYCEITNDAAPAEDPVVSYTAELVVLQLGQNALRWMPHLHGDLKAYWPMDGDASNIAPPWPADDPMLIDGSAANGGASFVTGSTGQAVQLDGIDGWVDPQDTADAFLDQPFEGYTIAMWVKADDNVGIQTIFDEGGRQKGIAIRLNDATLEGVVSQGPSQDEAVRHLVSMPDFGTDWHFIAIVFNGPESTFGLYVDNVLVDEVATEYNALESHSNNPGIGRRTSQYAYEDGDGAGTGDYFAGLIDEVMIWDRALSDAEIRAVGGEFWQPVNSRYDPLTGDGWIDPTLDVTLSWEPMPVGPCDATYDVYAMAPGDPSPTHLGTTNGTSIDLLASRGLIGYESTLLWRVDVTYGTDTVQGAYWSKETVIREPVIDTHPEGSVVVPREGDRKLTLVATATSLRGVPMARYQWINADDGSIVADVENPAITGATNGSDIYECKLELPNFQLANEGHYYCRVQNEANEPEWTEPTDAEGLPIRVTVLTERLMVHYEFEQPDVLADSSASGVGATAAGVDPAWYPQPTAEAKVGAGAMEFFGDNDPNMGYLDTATMPSELGLDGNHPRTVSVWALSKQISDGALFDMGINNQGGEQFCLRATLGGGDAAGDNAWNLNYSGMGYAFNTLTGVNFWSETLSPLFPSLDNWVHFVVVHDGERTRVFANGYKIVDILRTLNILDVNPLQIGVFAIRTPPEAFEGVIDDFRLYNYALSDVEAVKLYTDATGESRCLGTLKQDLDGDCEVTLADFARLAAEWMTDNWIMPQVQ
jgi:hypothetical protein